MSDTDDSAVVVEHDDAVQATTTMPSNNKNTTAAPATISEDEGTVQENENDEQEQEHCALQIVSIGTEADNYAFYFHADALARVLDQIPVQCPVAVVSVVGAFRTGKSFLLSWFLRYLESLETTTTSRPNRTSKSSTSNQTKTTEPQQRSILNLHKTSVTQTAPWYHDYTNSVGNDGFEWKAGAERNTTGIWMWSRPFLLQKSSDGNNNDDDDDDYSPPTALLLVDTQGMFDHETTMNLTASIFGFSTLLSSHQIYNVDKRIQEDNLQQLALFSEYARTAAAKQGRDGGDDNDNDKDNGRGENAKEEDASNVTATAPFQNMEFLVRDWQHFDDDDDDDEEDDEISEKTLAKMEASMMSYLDKVLQERQASDLADTRQQIQACFQNLSCYGLCHPGFAVTKKKYTGNVADMETLFVKLLDRYCVRTFANIPPKQIHGRTLTSVEFASYCQEYANLFTQGAAFPTAVTLLQATASANNTNALHAAHHAYTERMDRVAGPKCTNYLQSAELQDEHERAKDAALALFVEMANFGNATDIATTRQELQHKLTKSQAVYESLNTGRNPLHGMETYLILFVVAISSYVVRIVLDFTCAPHATLCQAGSKWASEVSAVVWSFLAILVATRYQQVKEHLKRLKQAFDLIVNNNSNGGGSGSGNHSTTSSVKKPKKE